MFENILARNMRGHVLVTWSLIAALASSAAAEEVCVRSPHQGDLLLFPAIQATHRDSTVSGSPRDILHPQLDLFYSAAPEHLRFLAEYRLRDDENEMERLQLGWLVHPSLTLWVGRFHSATGFWNGQHHHGAFLQTTISRPSILGFEDEAGPLPSHIAGLLAEGAIPRQRGEIDYGLGVGHGPVLHETLEPLNILDPRDEGRFATSGRFGYRADDGSEAFGAFAAYSRIPIRNGGDLDKTVQTVAGAYYYIERERLRLLGELLRVENRLSGPSASARASFLAGYLQPEYRAGDTWTIFGRSEASNARHDDPYLAQIPNFINWRLIVGSRIELDKRQAMKIELSRNERQDNAHFTELGLEWSMIYP